MQEQAVLADVTSSLLPPTPQDPPTTSIRRPSRPHRGLARLEHEPDENFLRMEPLIAGRMVIIVIYAQPDSSADQKCTLWQRQESSGTNLIQLGRAAQALERARFNWRKTRNYRDVIAAAAPFLDLV